MNRAGVGDVGPLCGTEAQCVLSAMSRPWQSFSKPVIDPVQLLESGRWRGNAKVFGFKVGCAAIAAIGV